MPPRFESSQLLAFHRRLCDGDRTASDELAELLLNPLAERISRQFPRADEHLRYQAVADALLDYCARPQQFDEGRGVPFASFLLMTCRRNLLNLLRGETRRRTHEGQAAQMSAPSIVELDPVAGNLLQQEENAPAAPKAAAPLKPRFLRTVTRVNPISAAPKAAAPLKLRNDVSLGGNPPVFEAPKAAGSHLSVFLSLCQRSIDHLHYPPIGKLLSTTHRRQSLKPIPCAPAMPQPYNRRKTIDCKRGF
jgi:DNA-directed RNA polymerase specialized sigma24 family protein